MTENEIVIKVIDLAIEVHKSLCLKKFYRKEFRKVTEHAKNLKVKLVLMRL